MHLHIEFTAENPSEFAEILGLLTTHLGERANLGSLAALSSLGLTPTPGYAPMDFQQFNPEPDQQTAEAKPKRPRGRPKLVKDEPAAPAEASPQLDALDAAMSAPQELPDEPAATPVDEAAAADEPELPLQMLDPNLKPEDMRVKGRQMLLDLVKTSKDHEPAIKRLVAKYGVKSFLEVPDDKAQEFLADAMMLVASASSEAEPA